jgi:O-antigen/teichoic acid export membrane protein
LPKNNIKPRFAISVVGNAIKGILVFSTGLIMARGLGPEDYGNFSFLLASFMAILPLVDMGSSNAFYTFLSQKPRGLIFICSYVCWQITQFLVTCLIILVLLPSEWMAKIWANQSKEWIFLAFIAVFMKINAWQTMVHIGESMRLTAKVQYMSTLISLIDLTLISVFWWLDYLSVSFIFKLIFIEYVLAIVLACMIIPIQKFEGEKLWDVGLLRQYRNYCIPLMAQSWLAFIYIFYDRWLLQHFSGPEEQAFFSIGFQFASVSLLATVSMLRIYWKEISEAHENLNLERIQYLYKRVSKFLYMVSAVFSGFIIPWSDKVVEVLLGPSYNEAIPVLAIMLLFPVHQSLGQVLGTSLLATENTKARLILSCVITSINLPVTYFVLAPAGAWIPGFELGSVGVSVKMVFLNIFGTNLMAWWIASHYKFKMEWAFQIVGLVGTLALSGMAYMFASWLDAYFFHSLFLKLVVHFTLYVIFIIGFIWNMPWVAGSTQEEIKRVAQSLLELIKNK